MVSARACVKKVKKRKNKKNKKDDVKSCTFVLPIAECHKALIRERREERDVDGGRDAPWTRIKQALLLLFPSLLDFSSSSSLSLSLSCPWHLSTRTVGWAYTLQADAAEKDDPHGSAAVWDALSPKHGRSRRPMRP